MICRIIRKKKNSNLKRKVVCKCMGMRSNQMRPSDRTRSYKNKKPSLLQIIGIKRLIGILVLFAVLFAGGYAILEWKEKKEILAQQQAIEQADRDDNYLNYMSSIVESYYGFAFDGTVNNVNFDFSKNFITKQAGTVSSNFIVSGVCNSSYVSCRLAYVTDANTEPQQYSYTVSKKDGVYYNIKDCYKVFLPEYQKIEDVDTQYLSLMDHASYVSYPADTLVNAYSVSTYLRGILESAKQDSSVELAKSKTAEGLAQYSAKIPAKHFAGDNVLALFFSRSDSPVICSVYSMGGEIGSRKFYVGFQQDDMAIQLTLTEQTSYASELPTYAVSEEHFLGVIDTLQAKIDAQKKKEKKEKEEAQTEESSDGSAEDTSEEANSEGETEQAESTNE